MTKIEFAKKVATLIVGMGTTKIVSDVIKNNVEPSNVAEKVTIFAGSMVIGSMASDATKSYTDAKIDAAITWWRQNVSKTEEVPTSQEN